MNAMATKRRANLADLMQDAPPPAPAQAARAVVVPLVQPEPPAAEPVPAAPAQAAKPEGRGVRRDKPHTTVYLDPAVRLAIKRVALDYNKKPHDLMLEGIDMMLIKYTGKPAKEHIT
jgi:hypothetical protein